MLKVVTSVILLGFLVSCTEDSVESSVESSKTTTSIESTTRSTTLEEFTSHFVSIDDMPTLDLVDMSMSIVLNKDSFEAIRDKSSIPTKLVSEWILPFCLESQSETTAPIWKSLFYNKTFYCISSFIDKDIKVYLLKINPEIIEKSELIHLGNISTFTYKDSSKEVGEEYDFNITDCEDLILEIDGDTLITKCMRYSATVGKDWRIDQNLYVNDTVKLPVIKNSYSLY